MFRQQQAQIQMSAYEKKVAYEKFQSTLKWLEKYVEIVHSDQFDNWENRKQFREDGIKRKDIIGDPKRVERLLSISFLSFEGFTDHPDLLGKMKEEFHQWISATGIDVDNCPEKLKNYLIGLSEILEGRGEKINEDAINRQRMFDEDSPEYAEGLNEFFRALQTPMNHARKEEKSLEGKKHNELEVGGRFSGFNAEKGEKVLERMRQSVVGWGSQKDFHYFPQKVQIENAPKFLEVSWDQDLLGNGKEVIVDGKTYHWDEGTDGLTKQDVEFANQRQQELINQRVNHGEVWVLASGGVVLAVTAWLFKFFGESLR